MSSTATSGESSSARASASAPFEASPTTAKPGSLSSTWRMPVRTIAWSSATSTRMAASLTAPPPGPAREQHLERRARRSGAPPNRTLPPSALIRSRMPARPMCPSRSSRSGLTSGGPRPSSRTTEPQPGGIRRESRCPRVRASAWRRTFESASWSARNRASSASLDSGGSVRGRGEARSRMSLRAPKSATSERKRGQEPEVVQQRGPEIVGDAPDAADAGVDQREHLVEPRRLRRARRRPAAGPAPS